MQMQSRLLPWEKFRIDTSVLNTDAVMDIRASHLKSNEKRPYYELIFPVYDLNNIQYQKLLGTCVFVLEPESFDDTLQNVQSTEDAVVFLLDSSDCILASAGSVESCGSTLASEILHSTSENIFSLRHFPAMTGKLPVSFRNQIFGNRTRT